MTDPMRPTDEELTGRIRRSLDHYRLEAPLPSTVLVRARPAWRFATLLAAGLAGALLTLVVLGATDGLRRGPVPGTGSPSATSGGPTQTPVSTPEPTTAATWPPTDVVAGRCLAPEGEMPSDWMLAGETEDQVWARIAELRLLMEDQRSGASLYVFGDDRFVVVCTLQMTGERDQNLTVFRMLRPDTDDAIQLGGAGYSGGAVDEQGNVDPADPPEVLLTGFASVNVARVEVVMEDGSILPATLSDGVWAAWWHTSLGSDAIRAYDAEGTLLAEEPHVIRVPVAIPPGGLEIPVDDPSPSPS